MSREMQEITSLIHLPAMIAEIEANDCTLSAYKDALGSARESLTELFHEGAPIAELISWQSATIDAVITHIWQRIIPASARQSLALVAVGGYGRAELHPHSDIDILILTARKFSAADEAIGQFVTHLWDLGLDVGHSVRDVKRCVKEAKSDLTVITNMIESRYICGYKDLYHELSQAIRPEKIWPVEKFFTAKRQEQRDRHLKFHGSAYRLEPNVKESPGGLRDIQTVEWILIRQYGNSNLQALVSDGYLNQQELEELTQGRDKIWRIRFLLHTKSKRKEDRLVFDYQRELANDFGYEQTEDHSNQAVEQFMQSYFRAVTKVERLNDMLLQLMDAKFSAPGRLVKKPSCNDNFFIVNEYIEMADDSVFERHPPAMLELFQTFASHDEVQGIGAHTLRSLKSNLHRINSEFHNPLTRELFMQLFREPEKITRKLRLMNRYGVMAAYVPAFEKIVGRMQYDLFHIYTVDEHTLMVIRNLRRFAIPHHNDEYPECSEIMQSIEKPELLYIIGLFHDIAKGRGGDHSILGAEDAAAFCKQHELNEEDSKLVEWTIRYHLEMSMTAQRKDTSDPDIILEFAQFVGTQRYLNFLYLLTVADIRGTNPELWNGWKQNLIEQLYRHTSNALKRGLDNPIDVAEIIDRKKRQASELITANKIDLSKAKKIWGYCDEQYFLQYSSEEISWHVTNLSLIDKGEPLILLRRETERGSTEIFIHVRDNDHLFSHIVKALDQLNLTIVSAQILTSLNDWTLNTFFVLDHDGETIQDSLRLESIRRQLDLILIENQAPETIRLKPPRRLTHFKFKPIIRFDNDLADESTSLFIKAIDRPGLLSGIGQCFADHNIRVISANITTLGETAEDSFYIQSESRCKITDEALLTALHTSLSDTLEQ